MNKPVKQCAGIDCAKKDFWVTFSVCDDQREIYHKTTHKFNMNDAGLKAFIKWLGKLHDKSVPLTCVLEATGVYHEKLTILLHDLDYPVVVVYPKRAKDFSKTLMVKKVTDKIASKSLATMGLEKKLELWKKPKVIHNTLRGLTRESSQLQEKITVVKNELEAENFREGNNKGHIKRLKSELVFLSKLKKEVDEEVKTLIKSDEYLNAKVAKLTSVVGLGIKTVACVVAETDGFSQVHNKRQLTSYAGYDVINQESGTSVHTKAKISKRGNKHIRKAMHMAALSSIRHGGNKDLFVRIVGKTGIKMKGVVAAQRKLLILMYTLWKNDTVYDPDYEAKKRGDFTPPLELDLVRS